jgi:hypothetical protein
MIIQCVEQWWAKAEAAGKQEALVGVESSCVDPATAPIADFLSKCLFNELSFVGAKLKCPTVAN